MAASSKWMKIPSPNCSIAGSQSASLRDRRAAHGQLDVLELAVRRCRRGLEAGETVEAGHLPQAMHGDEVLDRGQIDARVRVRPAPRAAASGHRASRSDGCARSPAGRWRRHRTRRAWATGPQSASRLRECAAAARRCPHPDTCPSVAATFGLKRLAAATSCTVLHVRQFARQLIDEPRQLVLLGRAAR